MKSIPVIRVVSAAAAALSSGWFVRLYSFWSFQRFKYEHRDENFTITSVNDFLLNIGPWTTLVSPGAILLFGLYLIIRHPNHTVLLEAWIQASFLLAFLAALFAILSWQAQNTPWFDLRGVHF